VVAEFLLLTEPLPEVEERLGSKSIEQLGRDRMDCMLLADGRSLCRQPIRWLRALAMMDAAAAARGE